MPNSRMRFNILCCSFIWASCHPSDSGPSQLLRLPMRCQGRWAGPVKKARISSSFNPIFNHTRSAIASLATVANGMFTPRSAIQSISFSQRSQSQ